MRLVDRFLDLFTKLFLVLHWIAVPFAVIAPLFIYPVIALELMRIAFVPLAPTLFVPLGPLSLAMHDVVATLSSFLVFGALSVSALTLGVAALIIVKSSVYLAVRRNRALGVSAVWPPMTYFLILSLIALPGLLVEPTLEALLKGLSFALISSTPLDLVIFSYVKFRDAVRGAEPERWIPALVALWTAALWPVPVIAIAVLRWADRFMITLVSTRAAVTILQLSYMALYIRIGRGATLLK